jgi:hypothetical protein
MLAPLFLLRSAFVGIVGLISPVGIAIGGLVAALAGLGFWIANNLGGLKNFFEAFRNGFQDALPPSVTTAIDAVGTGLKTAYDWLSKLVGPLNATDEVWRGWGYAAGQAVGRVVETVTELPSKVAAAAGEFASAMAGLAQRGWDAVKNFDWAGLGKAIVQGIIDGVASMGSALASKLSSMASEAWAGAKSKLGFGGGPTASAGTSPIEARAGGGLVNAGQTYLVGEKGPELFRSRAAGEIVSNDRLRQMTARSVGVSASASGSRSTAGTGGGRTLTTNHTWNITASQPNDVAAEVKRVLRRMEAEQHSYLSD